MVEEVAAMAEAAAGVTVSLGWILFDTKPPAYFRTDHTIHQAADTNPGKTALGTSPRL